MNQTLYLTLPGWQNSGPDHWQSRWEILYGDQRVAQHDWITPLRGDWQMQLETAVLETTGPIVLVAHSMGCALVGAWAAVSKNAHRIRAAFLVAPGDLEQAPEVAHLHSWQPMVLQVLPFPALLLGSQNDPYCRLERARYFANCWGAEFKDYGACGHINAASGLGDWPDGRRLLEELNRSNAVEEGKKW